MSQIALQSQFASADGTDITTLRVQEVAEVLEGPRKDSTGVMKRVYGKSVRDGAVGWFAITDTQGHPCAEEGKATYTCRSAIALTSVRDIKECEVIRKLEKNEILTALGQPEQDGESGVLRIRGRASKDGAEGWVTMKGNAGTVYVEATGKQYTILKKVPLQKGFQATSGELRMTAVGESFDMLEGPKEEHTVPIVRARVRATSTGSEGWVTVRQEEMRLWAPRYKCVVATSLEDALQAGSKQLRKLEPGERLDLLDGPKEYSAGSALRLKLRSKDGAIGWVTANGFVESVRS